MIPARLDPIVAKRIVPPVIPMGKKKGSAQGQHSHGVHPPNLTDIERMAFHVLQAKGDWVLIDRNRAARSYNDSSSMNNALRRRGFEVTSRHVQGVRNYWARWTHKTGAEPPLVPAASTDGPGTSFGVHA
jgi:hypothetical protein